MGDKPQAYWGETQKLSPEEMLLWLDEWRAFIFEVWKCNPEQRKIWEELKRRDVQ